MSNNKPSVDEDRIRSIYDDLADMEVSLDRDPLIYGPKRLNEKTAEVRHFLTLTERIFLSVSQDLALFKRQLRLAQADFKIAEQDLLANDPNVRAGRSVKDREALAAMKLRDEVDLLTELESAINDLEACLTVVKAKRTDLKDVQRALRDQIKLCQEEIGLGNNWGSKLPPGKASPIDETRVGSTGKVVDTINDLIGGIEGDLELARSNGEWADPEEMDLPGVDDEGDEEDEEDTDEESSEDEEDDFEDLGDVRFPPEVEAIIETKVQQAEADLAGGETQDDEPQEFPSDSEDCDGNSEDFPSDSDSDEEPEDEDYDDPEDEGGDEDADDDPDLDAVMADLDLLADTPVEDSEDEDEEGEPDEADYGVLHYCSATETCEGGRNDTGDWSRVTCPACLQSAPTESSEPEEPSNLIDFADAQPVANPLPASASKSDTESFLDNLDLPRPPSKRSMPGPTDELDLDDLISNFK